MRQGACSLRTMMTAPQQRQRQVLCILYTLYFILAWRLAQVLFDLAQPSTWYAQQALLRALRDCIAGVDRAGRRTSMHCRMGHIIHYILTVQAAAPVCLALHYDLRPTLHCTPLRYCRIFSPAGRTNEQHLPPPPSSRLRDAYPRAAVAPVA